MRFDDVLFFDLELVEAAHARALDEHGGADGVRDRGMLQSAIAAPQASFGGVLLHDTLCKMAAALAYALAKNHPFVDGNKRAAFLSAAGFLDLNGYPLPASPHWETLMLSLAEGSLERDELARAFAVAIGGDVPIEDA